MIWRMVRYSLPLFLSFLSRSCAIGSYFAHADDDFEAFSALARSGALSSLDVRITVDGEGPHMGSFPNEPLAVSTPAITPILHTQ